MSEETSVAEEVKEEPLAAPETPGAQEESLDDLLKEFEGVEDKPEQTVTEPDDKLATLERQLRELQESQQRKEVADEITTLGATIRGELPSEIFDDATMRAWLEARAQEDPRLQKAFLQRHQTPTAWKKVVDGMARDFQSRASKLPDKQVTEDVEAVAAAVRGASTKAPEESDVEMSAMDLMRMGPDAADKWRRELAKKMGF